MKYVLMDRSHVNAVAQLERCCFTTPWSVNAISGELTNPLSLWLVAVEADQVVGYVGSQSVLGEADMMNIAVDPSFRRWGIAQNLVEQLICLLRDKQVSSLTLEVRASNEPAVKLYEKMGFIQVGRRPGYYSIPREDALIYRKEWKV